MNRSSSAAIFLGALLVACAALYFAAEREVSASDVVTDPRRAALRSQPAAVEPEAEARLAAPAAVDETADSRELARGRQLSADDLGAPPPPDAPSDVVDPTAGVIAGIVLDSTGAPIEGASIRATLVPAPLLIGGASMQSLDADHALIVAEDATLRITLPPSWLVEQVRRLPSRSTTTSLSGEFRIPNLAPGSYALQTTALAHAPSLERRLAVREGEVSDAGAIALAGGTTVSGRILDHAGSPVAAAEVYIAAESPGGSTHLARRLDPTDIRGRFAASDVPAGRVFCAVRREPDGSWQVAGPFSSDAEIVLRPVEIGGLTLILVSDLGQPTDRAEFELIRDAIASPTTPLSRWIPPEPLELGARLTRLEASRYHFADLPHDSYVLRVRCTNHTDAELAFVVDGEVERTLHLLERMLVRLRVVDGESRAAPSASVKTTSFGGAGHTETHSGSTDAGGKLAFDLSQAQRLLIEVEHSELGGASKEIGLPLLRELEIVLGEPGAIEGRLTDRGGAPLTVDWVVMAAPASASDPALQTDPPRWMVPDGTGFYSSSSLAPGRYTVQVHQTAGAPDGPDVFQYLPELGAVGACAAEQLVRVTSGRNAYHAATGVTAPKRTIGARRIDSSSAVKRAIAPYNNPSGIE